MSPWILGNCDPIFSDIIDKFIKRLIGKLIGSLIEFL